MKVYVLIKEDSFDQIVVKPGVHCQWWMDCLRPATTTREHPIYGPVPICQGHNDDADDMEGKI